MASWSIAGATAASASGRVFRHLEQEGLKPPAPATISRILTRAGLVSPQPRKRPRSSYVRFEMAQPNEMWQSDFIRWRACRHQSSRGRRCAQRVEPGQRHGTRRS